ncbi:MAG: amidohydrolase family protein [Flavobacteriaceae bacterium]|nr:amidohydrolase family protein [Flavobacteriaceae bacterium]
MKKLALLFVVLFSLSISAQTTYIHCGQVFDSASGKIKKELTLIIEGNKIDQVVKGYAQPVQGATVIDLKSKTVYPGFIDMHVHIESESNPSKYLDKYRLNEADIAFDAAVFARRTLMAGFTTVRDLGGTGVNIALRNAIESGKLKGPRVFTAGKTLSSTGGHGDPTNGNKAVIQGDPGPKEGVVNSPADARKAVRQRYKNGADWIKITATGGVLSVAKSGENPQFTAAEIMAITSTAKDYGMQVAAHAHGDEGMFRAVQNGVKTIEHGTLISKRTMQLMKDKNAYLVPTISAGKFVAEKAKIPGYFPPVIVPKAIKIGAQIQQTFANAYAMGVPIAFGTDSGVSYHGDNAKEFGFMVEVGMPAHEAIQAATIVNAKVLERENELGQIAPGFFADIVASEANALNDIHTLENITFVMKNGEVVKQ